MIFFCGNYRKIHSCLDHNDLSVRLILHQRQERRSSEPTVDLWNAIIGTMKGNSCILVSYLWFIFGTNAATAFATKPSAFDGFHEPSSIYGQRTRQQRHYGWLENFFEPDKSSSESRKVQYPEQYPATYEMNEEELPEDATIPEAMLVLSDNC